MQDKELYLTSWQTKYKRVIHTNHEPKKTLAKTIQVRLKNVVSFCTQRIANAVAEGTNSKIMSIKRRVGGFRNIQKFKTAIFFYCGGLDLAPVNAGWTTLWGVGPISATGDSG